MDKNSDLLTQTAVLERGWKKSLVKKYLGEPDLRRPNPHYRRGPETCLFKLERVLEAEERDDFQSDLERARARSLSAIGRAERKQEELCEAVRDLKITVPKMSLERARRLACENYNERQLARASDYDPVAPETVPLDFLERITVNFLRHCCTNYDRDVDALFGKVGRTRAYSELRSRTLSKIAAAYPSLASECERQDASECDG